MQKKVCIAKDSKKPDPNSANAMPRPQISFCDTGPFGDGCMKMERMVTQGDGKSAKISSGPSTVRVA